MNHSLVTFWLLMLILILLPLSINILYAQDKPLTDNGNKIGSKYTNLTYIYQPYFSIDGKIFKDIPHENKFSLEEFAISGWIKTNKKFLEPAHIVNKGGFNSDEKSENMNYGIWLSPNGTIQGGFETDSGEDFEVSSTEKYNDGKWHFILLSYDGSILRLEIDGEKQIMNTNGVIPDATGDQPIRIGANSYDEDKFFSGNIDEVRIWNSSLSDQQISKIYTNGIFDLDQQILHIDFGKNVKSNNKNSSIVVTQPIENKSLPQDYNDSKKSQNKIIHSNYSTNIVDKKINSSSNNPNSNTTSELVHKQFNKKNSFNIAVASDWGCGEDALLTSKNIQNKNPEIVIAPGDLSYEGSSNCWIDIISPFKSKLKISMGDHEYQDTEGGFEGVVDRYLNPLNLNRTFYSFDFRNVHFLFIDPYSVYTPGSSQYQFILNDLKNSGKNPKIDWIFVIEHIPMYTSPSKHAANSSLRDIYHPLFDRYGVDLVLSGDNHNYQRTFPLKYNEGVDGSIPIITNKKTHNHENSGVIYIIAGTAGKSHYDIENQASFVAKQDYEHFGFLNIEINSETIKGTFYANGQESNYQNIDTRNNILDYFTISKIHVDLEGFDNL